MSLATTPTADAYAEAARLLAAPPPPHLTLEQRLSVPRAVRRLMPDRTPLADALEAALLRTGAAV